MRHIHAEGTRLSMTHTPTIALLRSPANNHHAHELAQRLPPASWADIPMPSDLPDDGETPASAAALDRIVIDLLQPVDADLVVYSRAYGAFTADSRRRLERVMGRPVVTAPGAVLAALTHVRAHRLTVLTPYYSDRHAYEMAWLATNGFDIVGDASLGPIIGPDATTTTAKHLLDAYRQLTPGDALYVACTMVPLSALEHLADMTACPVIAATTALADQAALVLAGQAGSAAANPP